ncbi:hypothetical protein [Pseudobacteroides cellulosolvens]|uniref:hypothetical protein n=1 Tax=Pseudobacteroides cellulosolvens TaxID=35825 RepID=UPI000681051C|nr:hypothetical protein [Pseudobacteroides cellulosolvens]
MTSTAPVGNYVEIGITPYNEANAEYLYNAFGKDMVKVIEGQQAMTMDTATTSVNTGDEISQTTASGTTGEEIFQTTASGNTGEEIYQTTASGETKETSQMLSPMVIALSCTAGAGILGSAIIVLRRRKAANS